MIMDRFFAGVGWTRKNPPKAFCWCLALGIFSILGCIYTICRADFFRGISRRMKSGEVQGLPELGDLNGS